MVCSQRGWCETRENLGILKAMRRSEPEGRQGRQTFGEERVEEPVNVSPILVSLAEGGLVGLLGKESFEEVEEG